VFEERYADGDPVRLPLLAEELVRLKADVIVTSNNQATLAARKATTTVPIVSANLTDPIGFGFVVSEARPGTNVTGVLSRVEGQATKQLEIARDLLPVMTRIGLLINPDNPSNVVQRREIEPVAGKLGVALLSVEVRTGDEVGPAFQRFAREGANSVVVLMDAKFLTLRRQIAAFALTTRLPTVYGWRDHVEDGGLISYGTDLRERFRRAATYVSKILKGEKPAELPVEFPTKLELVINLATAKALGLTVPEQLLARAHEVIE
jgi:putative ABC transport system substrate-binding protein